MTHATTHIASSDHTVVDKTAVSAPLRKSKQSINKIRFPDVNYYSSDLSIYTTFHSQTFVVACLLHDIYRLSHLGCIRYKHFENGAKVSETQQRCGELFCFWLNYFSTELDSSENVI